MAYTGKFRVKNDSMVDTLRGTVTHIASVYPTYTDDPSDYYSKDVLTIDIANNETSSDQSFTSESSKFDLWIFDLTYGSGALATSIKESKECGYGEGDTTSPV